MSGPVLSTAGKINALAKLLRECLRSFAAAMGTSGSVIALPPVFARVKEESEERRAVALAKDDLRDVRRANRDP